jgi:arabinofuranosyltransferase
VLPAVEGQPLRPASALIAALAALTRPEGLGIAALLVGLLAVLRRAQRGSGRELARWCLVFLALFLPYFCWRFSYYGELFPNTFYAKVGTSPSQVMRGLRYLDAYLRESGYWLLLPCLGLFWSERRARAALLGGTALGYAAYVVLVGGDGLPMYRFWVPVLPLLFLLVAEGTAAVLARFAAPRAARAVTAVLAVALCLRSALPAFGSPARFVDQDRREVAAWKEIGAWFAGTAPATASIAVIPAGAIPYFSRLRAIDMLGLNDATIAHGSAHELGAGQAGHEKYDVDYVLGKRPTYVLIGVYGLSPVAAPPQQLVQPYYPAELRLLESPRFAASYRLKLGHTTSGWFAYFERADS